MGTVIIRRLAAVLELEWRYPYEAKARHASSAAGRSPPPPQGYRVGRRLGIFSGYIVLVAAPQARDIKIHRLPQPR